MSDIEMGGASSSYAPAQPPTHDFIGSNSPRTQSPIILDDLVSLPSPSSQTSMMDAPSRHGQLSGSQLKPIAFHRLVESGDDYASMLDELQIKPERHDEAVTGILQCIRRKRIKNLQTATDTMIKDLTFAFLRGYGRILYDSKDSKEWLIPETKLQLAGRGRLRYTSGSHDIDGPNGHFYPILEPMWWLMRELCFEKKTTPKKAGQPRKQMVKELLHRELTLDSGMEADNDTELDDRPLREKDRGHRGRGRSIKVLPKVQYDVKQKQALNRIEKEIDLSHWIGNKKRKRQMTAEETDQAVQDLIVRLHEIRCQSDPDAFARSWGAHLGRLEEVENVDQFKNGAEAVRCHQVHVSSESGCNSAMDLGGDHQMNKKLETRIPVQLTFRGPEPEPKPPTAPDQNNHSAPTRQDPPLAAAPQTDTFTGRHTNLANEPFNTSGPPSPLDALSLTHTPLIPSAISLYITTSPPLHPYKDKSYHWLDAPISITDGPRFFGGIDMRAGVRSIQSYSFSYGWNDVMRLVGNDEEARKYGFGLLRQEIVDAAKMGVTRWRLKVLVVGEAPRYQKRV